jgi:hypothetical protein
MTSPNKKFVICSFFQNVFEVQERDEEGLHRESYRITNKYINLKLYLKYRNKFTCLLSNGS